MTLLAGIDLGTTALKGVIINEHGEVRSARKLLVQYEHPAAGSVEFSVKLFYEHFCQLMRDLLSTIPHPEQLAAISLSGATGNTLLLDENNEPLTNAISWQDKRPLPDSDMLNNLDQEKVHEITGWPFLEMFPLAHLAWLKSQKTELFNSATRYVMNISYIYYRLTGRFAIDYSTATTFYLQDQVNRKWHQPFLDLLGISSSSLPELLPSATSIGKLTRQAGRDTGLPTGTEVVLGSFDHPAAARGTGVYQQGSLLISCGTSWVGLYPVSERDTGISNQMLTDPFLSPDGPYAAMFSIPGIGNTIDALIEELVSEDELPEQYQVFEHEARFSSPGAHHITIDITRPGDKLLTRIQKEHHKRSDIFRAVMEAAVFELKRNIDHYEKHGLKVNDITLVGGVSTNMLWSQIMADITGRPVKLSSGQMAGAIGSAIMAGAGTGLFMDEKEGFDRVGGNYRIIRPNQTNAVLYRDLYINYVNKYHNHEASY